MKHKSNRRRRLLAGLIDLVIFLPVVFLLEIISQLPFWGSISMLLIVIEVVGYFVLFILRDYLFRGRSIGKRICKLKVVDADTLTEPSAKQLVVKNLFLFLGVFDGPFLIISGKSLGERASCTIVLREEQLTGEKTTQTPAQSGKITKKQIVIGILLLYVLCLLVYLTVTAVSIVNYGKKDEKQISDAAIILGAGASDAGVSPVYRERINHGIWLYENGYVDYLILTGGVGEGNTYSDAFVARQYALSKAVPEEAILIEETSVITEENLENAKRIMDENSFATAIIVSDPLHMKRAMLMANDYGIEACTSPTPTTMYRSAKTKIPFLIREEFFYIGYCVVRLFR